MPPKIGPYSVLDTIGQGGAGVVYRARGPDGRVVALKLIRRTDEAALRRFEREVRLQSGLGAPNGFVPVLDFGSVQGSAYLVLPFIEGGTLRARLKAGPLGVAETIALGRTLAKALGQAHALGIVHRDVKPENVLFTGEGNPLVADLGLAKHFRTGAPGSSQSLSLSRDGSMQGTAGYMAPEQARDSKSVGPSADVFSLGAVLYECLTGKPVFTGDTLIEVIERVSAGTFPPIEQLRKDVPRPLAKVITQALSVDPRARFADGFALERALAAVPGAEGGARRPRVALLVLALVVPSLAAGVAIGKLRAGPAAPSGPGKAELERAADLERRAYECLLLEDGTGAQAFADELIALDPKNARARALRAAALERRSDLDAARVEADAALALDDRCALALCVRACNATRAESMAFANRAVAIAPDSAFPYAYRAIQRISQNDREGALRDAGKAIELEPRCVRAWLLRGALHEGALEHDAAVNDASKAILLAPGVAGAWDVRARAHMHLDQLDLAIGDATKALAIEPKVSGTWLVRAAAFYKKGDRAEAVADAGHAIALAPADAEAWEIRAVSRFALGDHEGALVDATRALELEPGRANATQVLEGARANLAPPASEDAMALLRAASQSLSREEHAKAVAYATDALKLAPTLSVLWSIRSTARCFLKDYAGAERDACQAVDLEPANASSWTGRSLARRERGDLPGAEADATSAIALAPDVAQHWTLRSETRRRRRDAGGALADAAQAVWLAPGSGFAWLTLASCLAEAGQPDAARAALERAKR